MYTFVGKIIIFSIFIATIYTAGCAKQDESAKHLSIAKTMMDKLDLNNEDLKYAEFHLLKVDKNSTSYNEAEKIMLMVRNKKKDSNASNNTFILDPKMVAEGKNIYSQARAKYSSNSTMIDIFGSATPNAALALMIPEKVWNTLPKDRRDCLIAFIKSMIPQMKKDPDKYIGWIKGAYAYNDIRSNVQRIADGRYVILTTVKEGEDWIVWQTVSEGK